MMSNEKNDRCVFRGGSGRRQFLKGLMAGGLAAALGPAKTLFSGGGETIRRTVKNGVAYRRLGRTGVEISEISLGGSPLPGGDLFYQVMDRGVNYIDTSHTYEGGDKRYRTRYGMSMLENLENIRKRGIRRFVQEEKARWKCPSCGKVLCVHRTFCLSCGEPRPGINV